MARGKGKEFRFLDGRTLDEFERDVEMVAARVAENNARIAEYAKCYSGFDVIWWDESLVHVGEGAL